VGDEGLLPELLALPTTRSKKPGICHFIYGEDTYFYTPLWQHANQKIIATYHYPPQRLNERVSRPVLKGLSAVILMSESQRAWFEQYLPPEKVFVVNHHVNTEFFHPLEQPPVEGPIRIMSVGGILRDMDLLLNVVKLLTESLGSAKVQFDFLIPKEFRAPFEGFSNVNFYARISDEELRSLYQNATLGFMPLVDCTANNAILEMMACGKAIVCSNVGGISDYVDSAGALMFPSNLPANDLLKDLLSLLEAPEKLAKMGKHNRAKAISEFSLDRTTEKLFDVYQQVAAKIETTNEGH
jgi:glycosyltransferase involved in cell wall biosynthesis